MVPFNTFASSEAMWLRGPMRGRGEAESPFSLNKKRMYARLSIHFTFFIFYYWVLLNAYVPTVIMITSNTMTISIS